MKEDRDGYLEDDMIETVEDWNDDDVEQKKWLESYGEVTPEDSEEEEPVLEEDRDAWAEILVEDDKMSAAVFVHEPEGGGRDIIKEDILKALAEQGITYGIQTEKIVQIAEEKSYRQLFTAALGRAPVDGKNGKIKDYFPRQRQLKFKQKENGGIDFKHMNLIHNVKPGVVVCDITLPEDAEDGENIFGQRVQGKRGKMPPIPQGRNIVFSEEKDKLLTASEGNLTFRNGCFHVDNVYEVPGDVDNSVGNIKFTGSVNVRGDVYEGYTIRAKGDITVQGVVEGAQLYAEGNIILYQGMRGMKTGVLHAKGDVTGKFLEDCTIYAKGNVQAEYIINSNVSCENDVILSGRRGAFIGGRCAVYHTMKVKTVGSRSHAATDVILGVTPELLENVDNTKAEIIELTRKLGEHNKNIEYLNSRLKNGVITESQKRKLNELKIQEPVNQMQLVKLKRQLAEMNAQIREVGQSRLMAEIVYPGTVLHIGDSILNIKDQEDYCTFYYMDGEIQRGMY